MKPGRPLATFLLLGFAWQVAYAADYGARSYQAYPADARSGGATSSSERGAYAPRAAGPGSTSTWGGAPSGSAGGYAAPSGGVPGGLSARDRPPENYRFRPRADERNADPPDTLRFRPDPDLARRSYQNWGNPGQEWSEGSRGPAVIFRPRGDDPPAERKSLPSVAYPEPPTAPGYFPEWAPPYGPPY